jgi:hypothetical protein
MHELLCPPKIRPRRIVLSHDPDQIVERGVLAGVGAPNHVVAGKRNDLSCDPKYPGTDWECVGDRYVISKKTVGRAEGFRMIHL